MVADEVGQRVARKAKRKDLVLLRHNQRFAWLHPHLADVDLKTQLLQDGSGMVLVSYTGGAADQKKMGRFGHGLAKSGKKSMPVVANSFLPDCLGGKGSQ